MKSLRIVCVVSNREYAAVCKNLDEVAEVIDDFSTDHCEGCCQLYMKFDGNGNMYPVRIYSEEVNLF